MSHVWRPVRAQPRQRTLYGVLVALAFNLCMFVLPVAGAAALLIVARDHLYDYEYSESSARAIRARVERLNGDLIQLDFDRLRQWDDLVALELMGDDIDAARGFLLSGGGMLPDRLARILNRSENDAEREAAALELLSPGTRARYESTVPLLARRSASGAERRPPQAVNLGDEQDFELMARALLSEPETDTVQFILTGFGLGLAGEPDGRMMQGAAAVLLASRRPDYPVGLQSDIAGILNEAVPIDAFRANALAASAQGDAAGGYDNASAAFRAAVDRDGMDRARAMLHQIGAMAQSVSISAAADLMMHAGSTRDLPRLRLLAQAAGERAAAAAKRLPRDGRLLSAARGDLTMNRDLAIALSIAALALIGLIAAVALKVYQAARPLWAGAEEDEDDYGGELIDLGGGIGASNWRPL